MSVFTFAALILVPFSNAFYFDHPLIIVGYLILIDIIMVMDIILQFFTGYYDKVLKKVTLEPKIVFM
jgi:hypothetical protein